MVGDLSVATGLSVDEIDEFTTIVGSGILTVNSDIFRGRIVGGMLDQEMVTEIVFVIDRDEKIRFWQEK